MYGRGRGGARLQLVCEMGVKRARAARPNEMAARLLPDRAFPRPTHRPYWRAGGNGRRRGEGLGGQAAGASKLTPTKMTRNVGRPSRMGGSAKLLPLQIRHMDCGCAVSMARMLAIRRALGEVARRSRLNLHGSMFEPPEFSNRHRLESAMAGWGCRGLAARPTHSLPPPNRWAQPVTSSADQRGVAVAPVGGGFE